MPKRAVILKRLQDRYPIPKLVKYAEVDDGWMDDASCAGMGTDLFFDEYDPKNVEPALKVCGECLVQRECLSYALETFQRDGIWGGTTPDQRKALLRGRTVDLRFTNRTKTST